MNNKFFISLIVLFGCSSLSADAVKAKDVVTKVELSQGYRRDSLDFSISGPDKKPDILSELRYRKVDVYMTRLAASVFKNHYFLRSAISYGNIYDGRSTDNDYLYDHRKGLVLHSKHHISGDYTVDFNLTVGRNFHLPYAIRLAPTIGYGVYVQKLRDHGGLQQLMHPETKKELAHQKLKHNKSTYKATWYSPQIGFDATKKITPSIDLLFKYSFLYPLRYHAVGHWNLREESGRHFTDRNRSSKSFGNIVSAGVEWKFLKSWFVKAEYELLKFYARDGHASWGSHRQPFHKAHRTASEYRLSLGYSF